MTTKTDGLATLAQFLAPGANFARGSFHKVQALATTVDNIPAAIFALGWDPGEGGKLWGLAVVKDGRNLHWVICRQETSTTWQMRSMEIGGWQTQFCHANAQMLADGILRAVEMLAVLGRFLPEETIVAAKIFQPYPEIYDRDELIQVLVNARDIDGFGYVSVGGALCSINVAIDKLKAHFAPGDTVTVLTHQVIEIPIMYG